MTLRPSCWEPATRSISSDGVLMVDADLRKAVPVEQLKLVLQDLHCVSEKLFVVQSHLHHMVAQAFALGATAVVSRPREVIPKLAQIEAAQRAAKSGVAERSPDIVKGAVAFASIFSAAREGKPFKLSDAENATSEIINSIEQKGLGTWLDDVRRYHQGTFQHCLLVTGVAVGFALDIRFPACGRQAARIGGNPARYRQGPHSLVHSRQARTP